MSRRLWLLLLAVPLFAAPSLAAPPASSSPKSASSSAPKGDPSLVAALEHLKKAKTKLEAAADDPAGERAQALAATQRAIDSVERLLGVAPTASPAGSGSAQPLDAATLASTIAGQKSVLRKICFQPYALAGNANVKIDLRVGAAGTVNDAVLLDQIGGDPRVGRCVLGQAWWWKFPPAGADTRAVVPFVFVN